MQCKKSINRSRGIKYIAILVHFDLAGWPINFVSKCDKDKVYLVQGFQYRSKIFTAGTLVQEGCEENSRYTSVIFPTTFTKFTSQIEKEICPAILLVSDTDMVKRFIPRRKVFSQSGQVMMVTIATLAAEYVSFYYKKFCHVC